MNDRNHLLDDSQHFHRQGEQRFDNNSLKNFCTRHARLLVREPLLAPTRLQLKILPGEEWGIRHASDNQSRLKRPTWSPRTFRSSIADNDICSFRWDFSIPSSRHQLSFAHMPGPVNMSAAHRLRARKHAVHALSVIARRKLSRGHRQRETMAPAGSQADRGTTRPTPITLSEPLLSNSRRSSRTSLNR